MIRWKVFFDPKPFNIFLEELCGEEDAAVASSLNNLGSIHSVLGEHQIAKDYYQRSLALAKKRFGETHPQVAHCVNNLGIVHGRN